LSERSPEKNLCDAEGKEYFCRVISRRHALRNAPPSRPW
jgi:hypothetical protein